MMMNLAQAVRNSSFVVRRSSFAVGRSSLVARRSSGGAPGGFTLMELLVVIGIIAILLALTVVAVAGIARDAKLSTGKNRVISALGTARALAMQSGKPAGVIFLVQWDRTTPDLRQRVVAHVVQLERTTFLDGFMKAEFEAANGTEPLQLPEGIKVAGPFYNWDNRGDDEWIAQPTLANTDIQVGNGEAPGRIIGVIFGGTGELLTDVPEADTTFRFVDLDNDDQQDTGISNNFRWFSYDEPEDEVNILWVPFLAVFDDDEAREFVGDSDWNDFNTRQFELTSYINGNADRIHFNRYTGVAMK